MKLISFWSSVKTKPILKLRSWKHLCPHKGQNFCVTVVIYSNLNFIQTACAMIAPHYAVHNPRPPLADAQVKSCDQPGSNQYDLVCVLFPRFLVTWRGFSSRMEVSTFGCVMVLHTRTKGSSFALPIGCSIVTSRRTALTTGLSV